MIAFDRHGPEDGAPTSPDVFADDTKWTLFNPMPYARQGWFEVELFVKGQRREALRATNAQGQDLELEILDAREAFELISPLDEFPERINGHRYTVAVKAELPGLGALPLLLSEALTGRIDQPEGAPVQSPSHRIDNGVWRVELDSDGCLLLTDRRQHPPTPRRVAVMSQGDAGDTYNHSPVQSVELDGARTWAQTWAHTWEAVGVRHQGQLQELHLRIHLDLPPGLDSNRRTVLGETVRCSGELRLRLLGDEPLLRMNLLWHNAARDQRTRLVLTGVSADTQETWRDTAFDWSARPITLASVPEVIGRGEAPVSVQPSLSAVAAGPWRVAHRALHEHELIMDPHASDEGGLALAMTLVRSVGWMSRRDLRTRGVGAGPDLPTPQAQCLMSDHFELMLVAHDPQTPSEVLLHDVQVLRRPAVALRGHAARWAPTLDLALSPLQVSSCRSLPDRRLELRLWNPSAKTVTLAMPAGGWATVRADGQPDEGVMQEDGCAVGPHAVVTLRSVAPWSPMR
jgi:hypothetical protein